MVESVSAAQLITCMSNYLYVSIVDVEEVDD